jgi:hypothetical protein
MKATTFGGFEMEQHKATRRSEPVTLDDLRSGRRARINTREFAALRGCQPCTPERERWLGTGIPYSKDSNGRVWYHAVDVLELLDAPKHRGTHEYDTAAHCERLVKARAVLNEQ